MNLQEYKKIESEYFDAFYGGKTVDADKLNKLYDQLKVNPSDEVIKYVLEKVSIYRAGGSYESVEFYECESFYMSLLKDYQSICDHNFRDYGISVTHGYRYRLLICEVCDFELKQGD